jgi:hypothetical protein
LGELQKLIVKDNLIELEEQGLMQDFEFTGALAYNLKKAKRNEIVSAYY